jgi:hypothetical protein
MYLRTCGSLKSANYQRDWVRKSQIRGVPDLRQIRKSFLLSYLTNLTNYVNPQCADLSRQLIRCLFGTSTWVESGYTARPLHGSPSACAVHVGCTWTYLDVGRLA